MASLQLGYLDRGFTYAVSSRYRTKYETIRAWDSNSPEENIQRAKDGIEDMKLVLEAEGRNDQAESLGPLEGMLEAVEEAVKQEQAHRPLQIVEKGKR